MLRGLGAGREVRAAARKVCTAAGVLIAAFASLATSEACPDAAAGLHGGGALAPGALVTERYVASASWIDRLHLVVTGSTAGEAQLRVRFVPDDPSEFGAEREVTLAPRVGSDATADLELPSCQGDCMEAGVTVTVEHLSGTSAHVSWEVLVEGEECDDDVGVQRR